MPAATSSTRAAGSPARCGAVPASRGRADEAPRRHHGSGDRHARRQPGLHAGARDERGRQPRLGDIRRVRSARSRGEGGDILVPPHTSSREVTVGRLPHRRRRHRSRRRGVGASVGTAVAADPGGRGARRGVHPASADGRPSTRDVVLFVILPPLLYSAAQDSSYVALRRNARAIGLLAIALPLVSAVVVGFVAYWSLPQLRWPPRWCSARSSLPRMRVRDRDRASAGAAPQDHDAARGESLLNDATALTAYRLALGAAVGRRRPPGAASSCSLSRPSAVWWWASSSASWCRGSGCGSPTPRWRPRWDRHPVRHLLRRRGTPRVRRHRRRRRRAVPRSALGA